MAATPVGAVTTIRLGLSSLICCRKVVLPVPALPVRKMIFRVLRTYSNARSSWGFETKLMCWSVPFTVRLAMFYAFRIRQAEHRAMQHHYFKRQTMSAVRVE